MKNFIRYSTVILILLAAQLIAAQTTKFSYQGKLTDTGTPSATYDFEFRLFDVETGGTALATQQKLAVPVTNNVFSVTLDFGASVFDGSNRWLEIAVKRPAEATYTTLSPRHQISSVPYSVKTKTADLATNSSQLGGVNASEYVTTSTVGGSFIKNDTVQQTANFNINGNGFVGGRIGIGTTSPSSRLTIAGSGVFNAPNAARIDIYNSTFGGGFLQHVLDNGTWQFATTGGLTRMVVDSSGNVGIGTTTPSNNFRTDIFGNVRAFNNTAAHFVAETTGGTNSWARFYMRSPSRSWFIGTSQGFNNNQLYFSDETANQTRMVIDINGNVGIGTTTPSNNFRTDIFGNVRAFNNAAAHFVAETTGGTFSWARFYMRSPNRSWFIGTSQNTFGDSFYIGDETANQTRMVIDINGNVGIGTTAPTQKLDIAGTTKTSILQITGGSDLAENFEVGDNEIKPGMIVAIDPNNSGKLILARGTYNRQVAGIVSGANNLSTGMLLPDLKENENSLPIALSGRVWVYADATKNPIKPGDLLTTSDTPGYAMKVTKYKKAQGAIIGKAMTELKSGTGLVLVLVSLQ